MRSYIDMTIDNQDPTLIKVAEHIQKFMDESMLDAEIALMTPEEDRKLMGEVVMIIMSVDKEVATAALADMATYIRFLNRE